MHKHHQLLFRLSLVPLLAIAIAPLTAGGLQASILPGQTENFRSAQQLAPIAERHRSTARMERSAFDKAMDHCMKLRRRDPETICPDRNDIDTFRSFLPQEWYSQWNVEKGLRPAAFKLERAEDTTSVTAEIRSLNARDRAQLRQFIRLQVCPESLRGTALYRACKAELGTHVGTDLNQALRTIGVYPERAPSRPTVMDRIESIRSTAPREQPDLARPTVRRSN